MSTRCRQERLDRNAWVTARLLFDKFEGMESK